MTEPTPEPREMTVRELRVLVTNLRDEAVNIGENGYTGRLLVRAHDAVLELVDLILTSEDE